MANSAAARDRHRKYEAHDQDGFTLIELMLVVLIIAVLLATVIPTFLGARNNANARAAQANLRNGLSAEMAFFTYNQSFSGSTTDLALMEPNLAWTTTAPAAKGGKTVQAIVYQSTGIADTVLLDSGETAVILQAWAQDGNCYGILQVSTASAFVTNKVGTFYNAHTGGCTSPGALTGLSAGTGKASSNLQALIWYPSF